MSMRNMPELRTAIYKSKERVY